MTFPVSSPFPTPILVLDRVSKRFAGHIAVDELSLSVPRGVIYGLLGPNGAGKTTTIRMIMDILEPDGGAVRVFGEPGGGRAHSERIGYLPEERGLYRKMRVLDVLVFLGEMKGLERRRARLQAEAWLERAVLGIGSCERAGHEGHRARPAESGEDDPVLDSHHGAGRKAVRAAVHHCAGAEAGGWRALGHQADTERTPSRDRVRREPRWGRTSVCR